MHKSFIATSFDAEVFGGWPSDAFKQAADHLDSEFKKEIQGKFTIEYVDNSEANMLSCECGAKHVHWAPDQHSDWCPAAIFGLKKESKW